MEVPGFWNSFRQANRISVKRGLEKALGATESWKCQDSGSGKGDLPGVVLLYIKPFDFQSQRGARNSELGSGSIWLANFSFALRKSRFDEFPLIVPEGL
jgi:hypothetical protein